MLSDTFGHPVIQQLERTLAALTPVDAQPRAESRLAAVAAIVRINNNEPELLFIKRAEAEGDPWSGHIAFPGGRFEPDDASLEHTALRETLEELSLDIAQHGRVIGRLNDLAPSGRGLPPIIIRPFVAIVEPSVAFSHSREVAEAFWVPVRDLKSPEAQTEHVMSVNGSTARFPAYRVRSYILWGLTERIVRQLLLFFEPR